jgi:hypothetical protein
MPKLRTRPDQAAANPRVPAEPKLKLSWRYDGERLTGRWVETSAEQSAGAVRLPHVA